MSLTPSWNRFLLLPMLTAVVAGGCSEYNSSFVYSERTTSLIPEAQDGFKGESEAAPAISGVKQLVDDRFGNPQDLKAWLKLPVEFGGTQSAVAEYSAVEGVATVKFSVEEGKSLPETASSVQVVSGALAGETLLISNWDATTGQATLEGLPSKEISAGDSCVIDGGTVMQSGRVLYMRHCSHCHGTSGDGAGPTAQYLNPRPRDYRHGIFKFTSTTDVSKASRQDIKRVLQYGIPGTYMPSFLLLTDSEIHALVEYVRFLSLRGEYERKLVNELAGDFSQKAVATRTEGGESREAIVAELKEMLAADIVEAANSIGDGMAEDWSVSDTEEAVIVPTVARVPDSPESRRRGRELYLSKTLNCADCHGVDGAGNGPQTIAYEKNPITGEPYNEAGLHDVWDNLNQPRNLHRGIYRGGRRPIDLFARIHAGIKGSRMPSFKNTPHEDIWHVVNYVLSIPFEAEPGATGVVVAPPAAAAVAP
jgi:mono/diheme cytochrome c family protein